MGAKTGMELRLQPPEAHMNNNGYSQNCTFKLQK